MVGQGGVHLMVEVGNIERVFADQRRGQIGANVDQHPFGRLAIERGIDGELPNAGQPFIGGNFNQDGRGIVNTPVRGG